jgi:hypothetical protein
LSSLESHSTTDTARRTPADMVLQERSISWRKARHSIGSRFMGLSHMEQYFQYFPKGSVQKCSNIETPSKPYKLRCIAGTFIIARQHVKRMAR